MFGPAACATIALKNTPSPAFAAAATGSIPRHSGYSAIDDFRCLARPDTGRPRGVLPSARLSAH